MVTAALLMMVGAAAPKVISPEWNAVNVKKEVATFYADVLADHLRKQGLDVVTAQDVATLLGMERQKALLGCDDAGTSCMTELANALGAEATLMVNLLKLEGGAFRGVAKVISSSAGTTLSSVQLDAATEQALLDVLAQAAPRLAAPLSGVQVVEEVSQPAALRPPVTRFWWLFGLGGVAVGGAAAGLFAGAFDRLAALEQEPLYEQAQALAAQGKGLQGAGWAAAGVGAALLVTGVVLAVWPDAPVAPSVGLSPGGASLGVGGAF